MISGMAMLEAGLIETKVGCTTAWVIGAAVGGGGKRKNRYEMSLGRGEVLGVV